MNAVKAGLPLLLITLLVGCKNGTLQEEVPARLAEPSASARAELEAIVASAVGAHQLTLADHPFADSNVLIVETTPRRDPQGNRLPGRDLGRPERFQLLVSGEDCILLEERTGERWVLRKARCLPE
jgi:hypothetical protein